MVEKRVELRNERDVPILTVHSYFDAEAGQRVSSLVEDILQGGGIRMVIDLTPCAIVNSSGVATLLNLAAKVVQDCQGIMFLAGLDTLKRSVLEIGGVLLFAQEVKTPQEALNALFPDT